MKPKTDPGIRWGWGIKIMIESFALLLLCQLAGEVFTRSLSLSLPGPVAGMAVLFGILCWRGRTRRQNSGDPAVPTELGKVTDAIFQHFSLLFIPAATGIVAYFSLIKDSALAILVSIGVSTVLTFSVTALVFQGMAHFLRKKLPPNEKGR